MTALLCVPVAMMLTGCLTLKPNNQRNGVVLMEIPLERDVEPPPANTTAGPGGTP
jgi:hypothetical protein